MKLTAFFLLVALHLSAGTYSQELTLNVTKMPLEKVLKEVSDQSGYKFFYRLDQIKGASAVTLTVEKMQLTDVLDILFMDQPFTYAIANKTIVLTTRRPASTEVTGIAADSIPVLFPVHGKVVGKNGEPAIGITVSVMGARIATSTDSKGEFMLNLPDKNARLVLTGVDIATTIVEVKGRSKMTVEVLPRIAQLENAVVNKGYYTEEKALSTSDVETIKSVDIQKTATTNPMLAIEGRVAGLFIAPTSGLPGTTINVLLRGRNNFVGSADPLYVIDGVPFQSTPLSLVGGNYPGPGLSASPGGISPLSTINPSDIEEISVLKDADATAIYGSRGTNGVILITTKKGKAGRTVVNFDVSGSDAKYPKFIKMLNTQQYLAMRTEAFKNDGSTFGTSDYDVNGVWDQSRNIDWQKTLLGGTAHMTNAQGSISGGSSNTQFSISGGYRRQGLVYSHSDQADQQASFRASLDHTSIDKKFELSLTLGYSNDNNTLPTTDLTGAITLAPDAPALYTPDGKINWVNSTFINNPAAGLYQSINSQTTSITDNLVFKYHLLPGLTLQASGGYNTMELTELATVPGTAIDPADLAGGYVQRQANYGNSNTKSWILEPQASYRRSFGEGVLETLAGATFQENTASSFGFQGTGFSSDAQIRDFASALNKNFYPQQYSDYKYNAVYARINYTWKAKYILNLTARRDGSSRFGPGRQFGDFGAAGAAWIFTREHWFRNAPWLSFGKLRANYGTTGTDNTSNYEFLSTYSYAQYTYSGLTSLLPSQLENPNLAWDVNKKAEIGLDLGFIRDRINLSASYFRNRSGNQLVSYTLPSITGFNQVAANLPAVVQNSGLELTLHTLNVKSRLFTWKTAFNLTVPRNKWISFPGLQQTPYANLIFLGKSIFTTPTYRYTGVDPLTGILTYQDVNKDGRITPSDWTSDKELGQRLFGGFDNNFSWKEWQLDIFFQFVQQTGKSLLSAFSEPGGPHNQPVGVLARWQKPGDITAIQKFSYSNFTASQAYSNFATAGSNAIVNTSFIRLKNINLSYTLPAAWKQKLHLQNLQAYAQGDNLLTWTRFNGADPQVGGQTLPPLRQFLLGLRLSL